MRVTFRAATIAAALAAAISAPPTARALDPVTLDGTWFGGWDAGQGTQLILVGGAVIGFFWGGDYHFDGLAAVEANEADAIAFVWSGGEALLREHQDCGLVLIVREPGRPETAVVLARE